MPPANTISECARMESSPRLGLSFLFFGYAASICSRRTSELVPAESATAVRANLKRSLSSRFTGGTRPDSHPFRMSRSNTAHAQKANVQRLRRLAGHVRWVGLSQAVLSCPATSSEKQSWRDEVFLAPKSKPKTQRVLLRWEP